MFSEVRLRRVRIWNFRSIVEADVPLDEETTVLVGENGAGKTAILEALATALQPAVDEFSRRKRSGSSIGSIPLENLRNWTGLDPNVVSSADEALKISVELSNGLHWDCSYQVDFELKDPKLRGTLSQNDWKSFYDAFDFGDNVHPIMAYYGIDRNILTAARPVSRNKGELMLYPRLDRRGGYSDSFGSKAVFADSVEWFDAYEGLELREQRERGGAYRDIRLDAVRKAVESIIPEVRNLRMLGLPPRLTVDLTLPNGREQALPLDKLSGGYRSFIAMVIDIARRMVTINPRLQNPLTGPGFVLIDEIDLHLHPRWQQVVVSQLRSTFPNVQFVITTHSPQVVTTVGNENVRSLRWEHGRLHFDPVPSIGGAKSGRALAEVMGVQERPPAGVSEFVRALEEYRSVLKQDAWDSDAARALLARLQELSPDDPELTALSLERRRLEVLRDRSRR